MRPVIVTTSWDDGHKLDMKLAALLRRYGIKATFYICPEDREFPAADRLTPAEIREVAKDFEIGAHTLTHPHLDRLDTATAWREISDSKETLEFIVGKPLRSFCYPYGDYSEETKRLVREAGFSRARSVNCFVTRSIDPLATGTSVHAFDHRRDGMMSVLRLSGNRPWKVPLLRRWDNLAKTMFAQARDRGEVFHLWGHSWEIEAHNDWERLESFLAWLTGQGGITFVCNGDLQPERPKVLITAPYFKPRSGGLEEYVYQIAKGLQVSKGWDVAVVTSGDKEEVRTDGYENIRTYHLPYHLKLSNTPFGFGWYRKLKRIIAIEQPDVIDAHAPVPGMLDITAHAAKKTPLVVTYHTGSMLKGRDVVDKVIRFYESLLLPHALRKARLIICAASYVQRSEPVKLYAGKSTVVTPGIDLNLFRPLSTSYAGRHGMLHIGGLKSGEEHKGLDTSLRVAAALKQKYPDLRLTVAGNGDKQQHYEVLAEQLGISGQVEFRGRLKGQALVSAYQCADVLIVPSRKDARPLAVLEAMACGVPVVASTVEGIPDLVEDGEFGFLVEPDDVDGFVLKIGELFDDRAVHRRLSEKARRVATERECDWSRQVERTAQLLTPLMVRYQCPRSLKDVHKASAEAWSRFGPSPRSSVYR
jgi:peptidoglycan-N-acetylglucosamine deacetylase